MFLLPESRTHGCQMQKPLFPGPTLRPCEGVRARSVPTCGARSCGVRERREPGQRHGYRGTVAWLHGWEASVGRVLFAMRHTYEVGVRVDAWRAGRHGVFPLCGVGYAWTIGLVRRPVALSGMLLW